MRVETWAERLNTLIEERRCAPFQWGFNDCCLFAADAVACVTGSDYGRQFEGGYTDGKSARRVLRKLTGKRTLKAALLALPEKFGFTPRPVPLAQRGDLVMFAEENQLPCVCIVSCDGRYACGPGESGLSFRPVLAALTAWEVR